MYIYIYTCLHYQLSGALQAPLLSGEGGVYGGLLGVRQGRSALLRALLQGLSPGFRGALMLFGGNGNTAESRLSLHVEGANLVTCDLLRYQPWFAFILNAMFVTISRFRIPELVQAEIIMRIGCFLTDVPPVCWAVASKPEGGFRASCVPRLWKHVPSGVERSEFGPSLGKLQEAHLQTWLNFSCPAPTFGGCSTWRTLGSETASFAVQRHHDTYRAFGKTSRLRPLPVCRLSYLLPCATHSRHAARFLGA